MSANSGKPCCANGVASIRRVAKPKPSLRSTHMPSEMPCKLNRHRCAVAIRSAQTAPPTVCTGRPSRCAGGRRIRVLHSDPRRIAVHSQALGSEFILLHCPRHPCLTLPSRGRATSGFASCCPPLMSNVRRRKHPSVVISQLCNEQRVLFGLVDHPMLFGNAPGPEARQRVLQRFRFANDHERITLARGHEFIDASNNGLVLLLPKQVVFPGLIREDQL